MATRKKRCERKRASAKSWTDKQSVGFSPNCFTIPDGVGLARVDKEGPRRFDVLSYRAGKGNPNAEPGELHCERSYWVHYIGPDNRRYVCPLKTVGRRCPICEHRVEIARDPDGDQDLMKRLYPSQRQLWLVYDLNDDEAGLQLLDYSYHMFGKQVKAEIDNSEEDDEFEYFADLEDGLTIRVGFTENKPYGFAATSVNFKRRAKQYEDSLSDELPCLDDLIKVESYDKLKSIYYQIDEATEEDDSEGGDDQEPGGDREFRYETTAEGRGLKEGMEVEVVVDHEEWGPCTIKGISKDGTSLILEDDDGDVHRGIGCDEVEKTEPVETKPAKTEPKPSEDDDPDDDEKEEKKPPKKKKTTKKKSAKKPSKEEEEEKEEEEDDWDADWPDDDDD